MVKHSDLSVQQKAFCQKVAKGQNPTQAVREVYPTNTTPSNYASRLLTKEHIKAQIVAVMVASGLPIDAVTNKLAELVHHKNPDIASRNVRTALETYGLIGGGSQTAVQVNIGTSSLDAIRSRLRAKGKLPAYSVNRTPEYAVNPSTSELNEVNKTRVLPTSDPTQKVDIPATPPPVNSIDKQSLPSVDTTNPVLDEPKGGEEVGGGVGGRAPEGVENEYRPPP